MADIGPRTLVVGQIEEMPICGEMKPFQMMDQTTVCTVETQDKAGATRGAVTIGMSRVGLRLGFASYASIEEAEALVALMQLAIEDAKRIERGETPLAPVSTQPPTNH